MRDKRTPKDVCGEAIHLLYGAVLDSKVRSHFIIIHLYASDLVCAPKLLHNLYDFGCLDCPEKTISELSLMLPSKPRFHCDL